MPFFGFHASHEQIDPASLLESVVHAEQAGFDAAMCSDHFAPWSERQGQSGFAWAWLGAALQATSLPFGVVNAPGQRYHPAIIAQASATLEQMFPGRFWMALGSGEAANEHITGERWPDKSARNERLGECVKIMRRLFAGEVVTHRGHVTVDRAKLWTRPARPPKMIGAAVSAETAHWVGSWADGLITINQPYDKLQRLIEAFLSGGGEGKPIYLQIHLSFAENEQTALDVAYEQWRSNVFSPPICWDLELPEYFDEASRFVRKEDMHASVVISHEPSRYVDVLGELAEFGFDGVYLHHVGQEQSRFIDVFGEHVLPQLKAR
jgi:probable non-F420 flavinoid oxidoreductase